MSDQLADKFHFLPDSKLEMFEILNLELGYCLFFVFCCLFTLATRQESDSHPNIPSFHYKNPLLDMINFTELQSSDITFWFISNYKEVLGTIFSLIYLYFSIKQNIWLWPLGLISSAIYIYVFYNAGIYADMGLYMYYVIISIYGWYHWSFGNVKNHTQQKLKVQFIGKKMIVVLILITALLFIIISQILINFTDSEIPYWDAFTTAVSITATWMLAKKYIEHWLIWIVVDLISSGLYFYKELYFTIFLYLVYASMAIIGYFQWKKDTKTDGRKS